MTPDHAEVRRQFEERFAKPAYSPGIRALDRDESGSITASHIARMEEVWDFIESKLTEERARAREEVKHEFNDCTCQEKWTLGVVHRKDGPCYWPPRDAARHPQEREL